MEKIHHLTFGNNENHEGFIRFKSSCDRLGISVINIGKNVPYTGHGVKIITLVNYLKKLSFNDFFLFTDAYDVIFIRDPKDGLLKVFESFEVPLVYSTEQYFHFVEKNKFGLWLKHPKSKGIFKMYKYLNSGIIMGRVDQALDFFSKLKITEQTPSDQSVAARYYIQEGRGISLDYNHLISTNTSGRESLEKKDFGIENGLLKNKNTDSFPYIMHYPGENTYCSEEIRRMLPFEVNQLNINDSHKKTYFNGKPRKILLNHLNVDNYEFNIFEATLKYLFITAIIVLMLIYFFQ